MEYFNFFSQYKGKNKKSNALNIKALVIGALVIVGICAAVYVYFVISKAHYQSKLDYLDDIRMDSGFIGQYNAALQVSSKIENASQELTYLMLLDQYIEVIGTVNPELMQLIKDCLRSDSYLNMINVEKKAVYLQGYVSNLEALTEIERNFRACGAFSSVMINKADNYSADRSIGMIEFYCELILNGGAVINEEIDG